MQHSDRSPQPSSAHPISADNAAKFPHNDWTMGPYNSEPCRLRSILFGGGYRSRTISLDQLKLWTAPDVFTTLKSYSSYELVSIVKANNHVMIQQQHPGSSACKLPLIAVIPLLTVPELKDLCRLHQISCTALHMRPSLLHMLTVHECKDDCEQSWSILVPNTTPQPNRSNLLDIEDVSLAQIFQILSPSDLKGLVSDHILSSSKVGFKVGSIHRQPPDDVVDGGIILRNLPLDLICRKISVLGIRSFGAFHGVSIPRKSKADCAKTLTNHVCSNNCGLLFFVLVPIEPIQRKRSLLYDDSNGPFVWETTFEMDRDSYPPKPCTMRDVARVMAKYCQDLTPEAIEENGCAVCGQLVKLRELETLNISNETLNLLVEPEATKGIRVNSDDVGDATPAPVLIPELTSYCLSCRTSLANGIRPKNALANYLWLGRVPEELKDLTLAEQSLISRVRYNRCVVRISSGHAKMIANVIAFEHPTLKIYDTLPMPRKDLEEVLAVVFTGVNEPSQDDLKRTPVLVRRNKVKGALEWLKLNHSDYADLEIDYNTLNSYPLEHVPVDVLYNHTSIEEGNVPSQAKSQFDNDDEMGTESGPCPFTVHGLTTEKFERMSTMERKAAALQHVHNGGSMMAVGHDTSPQSIYDNPTLYPKMFPWLFPYGLGGVGQAKHFKLISKEAHLKWLLMYYDKRFQEDAGFIIVAFNHQVIKQGTSGSFMMVKRNNFVKVAESLRSLNPAVLTSISERLKQGIKIVPETAQEKQCFSLLDQIEYVGGHVNGSIASKKFQRNEVWSLISFNNAPSWFLTLSFCDNKHPLCLYLAGHEVDFKVDLMPSSVRQHLITRNPVACARFFHYLVELFLRHICGWHDEERIKGIFGKPSAYYGTVEQQGRMTLHLHLLLWIDGAPPPQVIRERLMANDSVFQSELIAYLESCQVGEFLTGSKDEVTARVPVNNNSTDKGLHTLLRPDNLNEPAPVDYQDPTLTLPEPPPIPICNEDCGGDCCQALDKWYKRFKATVDDLLLRSNVHRCFSRRDNNQVKQNVTDVKKPVPKQHLTGKGCINRNGECTARFPRDTFLKSMVSLHNGHVNLKKLEPYLNNVTPVITALCRCNTDTTCLLSGTAVKATVGYVTDYLTKAWLKTHQVFSAMYDAFNKNISLLDSDEKPGNSARKMVLKIVNSLSSKMEVGAPMAALFLLGNPDRYCSHEFVSFYWRNFVTFVRNEWIALEESENEVCEPCTYPVEVDMGIDRVANSGQAGLEPDVRGEQTVHLRRANGYYVGKSSTDDYRYRPVELDAVSLYEWIQCSIKVKASTEKFPDKSLCFFEFLPDHPLSDTHLVACDPRRRSSVVPNLLGGSLPRKDVGDREYYCCTMLTLFQPWRTGLDLKSRDESWENAFDNFQFTDRQNELMSNFNMRYECYDAQDDFAASLRKTANGDEDDSDDDLEGVYQPVDDGDYDETSTPTEGPCMKLLALARLESFTVLKSAGWEKGKKLINELRTALKLPRITLDGSVTSSLWNRVITAEKKMLWNRRFKAAALAQNERTVTGEVRNDAYIVPASFLSKDFLPPQVNMAELMTRIVAEWSLNTEQEKAFRIIANHATCVAPDQLLMHLGGMGGTGKSRVIKAIDAFFTARNESYRFVLLAPTGTAAALIGGTTYHSFLAFKRDSDGTDDIGEVIERLKMVGYIFLDETSMISCLQLCRISARCCDVLGVYEKPFGGLNVILCGDFSQLPPVGGLALFNRNVLVSKSAKQSDWEQLNTIGRCIWLQFTTVVILKENMRQKSNENGEELFRTALENLRYHACTDKDIALIRSRITSSESSLSIDSPGFKNVAIITSENRDKDLFNDANAERFAAEYGEQLYEFRSIDSISGSEPKRQKKRGKKQKVFANIKALTRSHRFDLWSQPPHTSDQIPGTLRLCIGMPILIRYNVATDLCITRGQEGRILGWTRKRYPGMSEQFCLDVLYVELTNPPHSVQLPNLPENVVPITGMSETIDARMANDKYVHISRWQVPVLPNFAMTDYSSQGKTREFNVVDLANARKFQAAYTCLSRGTSLAGTLILRSFDNALLSARLDPHLKREFRELNYLDKVTDLQYMGSLPEGIICQTRWATIDNYVKWKSTNEEDTWHPAIRTLSDKDNENRPQDSEVWSKPQTSLKRKDLPEGKTSSPLKKKARLENVISPLWSTPLGPLWDSTDHSCAFDAWTCVLYWIWQDDPSVWECKLTKYSAMMQSMIHGFRDMERLDPEKELTEVRNMWRSCLRVVSQSLYGTRGVELVSLSLELLGDITRPAAALVGCESCGLSFHDSNIEKTVISSYTAVQNAISVQDHVDQALAACGTCPECNGSVRLVHSYEELLCFQVADQHDIFINARITASQGQLFRLAGIIYFGDSHFIARVITTEGKIYSHDGMRGSYTIYEGALASKGFPPERLNFCEGKRASIAIYVQESSGLR